jgi:hypothetical protein
MQLAIESGNWNDVLLFAGRVAHYVEDDTQPYHTTIHYNPLSRAGVGLHSKLDASLAAHLSEIHFLPSSSFGPLTPIENLTDFALKLAVQSHGFLSTINQTLIDQGLDWSPELTKIIENRTNTAIEAVARVWYTAIVRAKVPAPEIPAVNRLFVTIESVTKTDSGPTTIQLRVTDSLGVGTYADVSLMMGSSTYHGQVDNVVPPIGEYVVVSEEGLHQNVRLTAQREGYSAATITMEGTTTVSSHTGSISSGTYPVPQTILSLPIVTVVALVVMFSAILALLVLSRNRDS